MQGRHWAGTEPAMLNTAIMPKMKISLIPLIWI
jgi:hypothetical protein